MDSPSEPDNKLDSVSRLRDYVREYKLQRGEVFIDVDETKDKENMNFVPQAQEGDCTKDMNNSRSEYAMDKELRLQRGEVSIDFAETSDKDVKLTLNSKDLSADPQSSSSKSDPKTDSKRLSSAAKHFMDNQSLSSSSSTSSFTRDYDEDFISYSDGRRPSYFIESSKVSLSSDEEEDPLPFSNLMELILSEDGLEIDRIYNDWDSGLSQSSTELNQDQDAPDLVSANVLEVAFDFPHRALRYMECQICLEMDYLRRRVCCDFQICNKCLLMYLSGKVTDGKVQIECANDRCNSLMYKDEIRYRLPLELREKFARFLIDANKDPHVKTCPSCSLPHEIDPAKLNISKKKLKRGVAVTCTKCRMVWCFRCQAPFHTNVTCKKYRNEDEMVKRWAKGKTLNGQANAKKCPKCKIFVERIDGCDHMKCSQCMTNFCYKCGDRYISVKFFGSHWNRFSLFGCKYRLMPEKNGLRRLIRGSHFVGRVLAAIVFAGLGVAAGAVLVAGSVVILPGYGLFVLKRRMWAAKQRKKFDRVKLRMITAEKHRALREKQNVNIMETVVEESETETLEQTSDPQQIQVIVHQHEEAQVVDDSNKDGEIIVNKYASDSDIANSQLASKDEAKSIKDDGTILNVNDVKEVVLDGKRKKMSFNHVSSPNEDEEKIEDTGDSGVICDDNNDDGAKCGKEGSRDSICVSDGTCSHGKEEKKDVAIKEERKPHHSDLNSLQCHLDNVSSVKNSAQEDSTELSTDNHLCTIDVQNSHSLSTESNNVGEKIIMKSKVLKIDIEDKNPIPIKGHGENEGQGCFGNIFNVSKRTTGVSSTNDEDPLKINKDKDRSRSVNLRKAATWEKCRRSKVEIDSSWTNKSSNADLDNSKTNTGPFVALKSSSSFSSVTRCTFASVAEGNIKNDASNVSLLDRPFQQHVDCNIVSVDEQCADQGCAQDIDNSTNHAQCINIIDQDESIAKIKCEITTADSSHNLPFLHDSDQLCQISSVTHL